MSFKSIKISKIAKVSAVVAAAMLGLSASASRAATVDLGAAAGYSVLALDSMSFNGPGLITGNVGVGQSTNFASPAVIDGTLFLGFNGGAGNITPTGGIVKNFNLTPAITAAQNAAAAANALVATQTFGTLGNNATINGNGGSNVVDVSGISLSNGVLTLHGSASDSFVINDAGGFTFSNSGIVLSGGVTAANVLFNIGGNVALTGGGTANFFGTILAPNSSVSVHDKTLTGELIGLNIADTSGFKVSNPTPVPLPAPVAACSALLGIGLVGSLLRRKSATLA